MRPTTRALGLLSAAALVIAACGGATPTTAPTGAASTVAPATTGASTPPAATTAPVATAAAKLCDDVTQAAPATEVEASIADFAFSGPVQAKVGQVITWTNADSAPHGVQTDASGCKMNGSIAANQKRSLVFNEAGTFPFFCFVHTSMRGEIVIT
jgi:plastocyanin